MPRFLRTVLHHGAFFYAVIRDRYMMPKNI